MVSCAEDNSFSGIFGGACGGPNTTKPFIVCFSWIPARFLAKLDIISGEITTHTFTYGPGHLKAYLLCSKSMSSCGHFKPKCKFWNSVLLSGKKVSANVLGVQKREKTTLVRSATCCQSPRVPKAQKNTESTTFCENKKHTLRYLTLYLSSWLTFGGSPAAHGCSNWATVLTKSNNFSQHTLFLSAEWNFRRHSRSWEQNKRILRFGLNGAKTTFGGTLLNDRDLKSVLDLVI